MKYLGTLLMSSLVAACAADRPPPASSDTVAAATDTPSNSTTPVQTDVMRAAEQDRRDENRAVGSEPGNNSEARSLVATPGSGTTTNTDGTSGTTTPGTENRGASTTPTTTTGTTTTPSKTTGAAATGSTGTQPDNTARNERDRSGDTLTPMDQGESEADRKITQQVRQALMGDKSLSFTAKNVKIITINGKVTLRGTVPTQQERASIEAAARKSGASQVDNLLEVKK